MLQKVTKLNIKNVLDKWQYQKPKRILKQAYI